MRILLAEDEISLTRALIRIFQNNNFSVDAVYNGEDALTYLESGNYDAAVLDIMMPRINGIEVLQTIRAAGNPIPVLLLTARTDVEDRVKGLDSGADYYLPKPFDSKELIAAVRAITRSNNSVGTQLKMGNVTLDRNTFELSSPNGSFRLANKEFQMMELFLSNPQRLLSTERLMEKIWGFDSDSEINVVWVYISYLRKKLIALGATIEIKVSRNAGYTLEEIV